MQSVDAAEFGAKAGGLSRPDRAMLYRLALGTGFRADELATLTPERFALDSDPPTVTVMACYAKNGHGSRSTFGRRTCRSICPLGGFEAPGRPGFEGMTDSRRKASGWTWRRPGSSTRPPRESPTFTRFRSAYVTASGRVGGASVKTCQTLALHSTPSSDDRHLRQDFLARYQGSGRKLA